MKNLRLYWTVLQLGIRSVQLECPVCRNQAWGGHPSRTICEIWPLIISRLLPEGSYLYNHSLPSFISSKATLLPHHFRCGTSGCVIKHTKILTNIKPINNPDVPKGRETVEKCILVSRGKDDSSYKAHTGCTLQCGSLYTFWPCAIQSRC